MQKLNPTAFDRPPDRQGQSSSIYHAEYSRKELMQTLVESVEAARPRLLRLAQMSGVGSAEAEDVVQETYLEAWRHLEKLQPERVSAWLDGICRNICKRHIHAKSSTPQMGELPEAMDEAAIELFDPLAIDPAEELEREDMHVLLDRALGHLSESTRELIELCYLAELPQREVAERLSLSLGALELKLHRARRQLHQILHGELRSEAQEAGLNLSLDEAMGWQETRQWCLICGKRRLRGIIAQEPGGAVMRLRCPECSQRYQMDYTNTGHYPGGLGPIRSFRPAMKRLVQVGAEYYQACLSQQQCPTCHSQVQVSIIDRRELTPPYRYYDALPLGVYARVDCPVCGSDFCEAYYLASLNPTVRDFLLRPRVLYEPATFTTYKGSSAISFGLRDLANAEMLTVLLHPRTLHVLATFCQ
ncbi:sigma-70 family RNA polymerase sigma factor [Ktedonosporobacter rubrisoli]|uniref:RNA polymerase sigma factor n=1 Tax=Ktedonosporobacter rubrisoli TaxID=2509675 RepID=A0A4P6JL12_KTERU|nr:sigma-70 family RNA polymerase sigma factor [Ktedonosporobacter rubrisoli]QBD75672.1 sigma-70 family RNA polymerase sigma factor [Ktedonosporobacter rubrisoli]